MLDPHRMHRKSVSLPARLPCTASPIAVLCIGTCSQSGLHGSGLACAFLSGVLAWPA